MQVSNNRPSPAGASDCGILYVATGAACRAEAVVSARSVKAAWPQIPTYVYPAGHGFDGTGKGHDAPSAQRARERTLALFREHVG